MDIDFLVINPTTETTYPIHTENNINVGLLSIASYVNRLGYNVSILDLALSTNPLEELRRFLATHTTRFIAISCTSSFSYRSMCDIVESGIIPSGIALIIGGQQVIGLKKKVFDDMPSLRLACFGEGETTLQNLLKSYSKGDLATVPGLAYRKNGTIIENNHEPISFESLGPLNHKLYPGFAQKIPTVEESRGCPYACNFCNVRSSPIQTRIKDWRLIVDEMLCLYELYGKERLFVNMGCSTFGMSTSNTLSLFEGLVPHAQKFTIQAYTRCDIRFENWMPYLRKLNISSVYFGMESASPLVLERMNKTTNPERYIERSQKLIDMFYNCGINLWCNFIIGYVGETPETLNQTVQFILRNRHKIGFLTCSTLYACPGSQILDEYDSLAQQYGISVEPEGSIPDAYHLKINPSADFTQNQMKALAQILPKIVNTRQSFSNVYAWRWQGLDNDTRKLAERMDYLEPHEVPFAWEPPK